jgi:hypothetical protein
MATKERHTAKQTKSKKKPKKSQAAKYGVMYNTQVMAVYGDFLEGFRLIGPFTDLDAAEKVALDCTFFCSVEPPSTPNVNWENNGIQFARLIAEIEATGQMHGALVSELCDSMDLTSDEVYEIVGRAQKVWDKTKERT